MRLAVSYSGAWGGAERVLVELVDALGPACRLACPPGPLADAAMARGIGVLGLRQRPLELRGGVRTRAGAMAHLAGHAREVRELIDALAPEGVIAWGMRSALAVTLGVPRARRPPVVFGHNDFLPEGAVAALVRRAAASAERVIVPSAAVAADLDPRNRLGDRLSVVAPGIDVDSFSADAESARPPEVLVLGALVEWKRPDLALEALALARAHHPELRLILAGGPLHAGGEALEAQLRRRAAAPDLAGAVEFAGAVDDPRPLIARAACLLHCAPREPFGMAVVEALAAGRPVVVPDAGGPREIVDPTCGITYAPGDPAAAAEAILTLLADPQRCAAMGAAGRHVARERFEITEARRRLAEVATLATTSGRPGGPDAPAIVTVTHDSAPELERLLGSVALHLPGARVVVVDCASSDGSREVAARAREGIEVEVLALPDNPGFGAANNRGIALVQRPVTALLNPDVELLDGSLRALVTETLRPGAPPRLLAPLVLSPDGSRQDTVHPLPVSPAELTRSVLPAAAVGRRAAAALGLAPWQARSARRVGWAVGCAIVARTDTLIGLGPFDDSIFLFGEDLDLGLRAGGAGIETWFRPEARVLHAGGHSTTRAFGAEEPFDRLAAARHAVVARRLGRNHARLDDASQALTFLTRLVLKRLLGRPAERERRRLRALQRIAISDWSPTRKR